MSKKVANVKRTSRTVISHLVVASVGAVLRATHAFLKAIAMPWGEVSGVRMYILYGINWIGGNKTPRDGFCAEISDNALMEIATGQSLCLQHLQTLVRIVLWNQWVAGCTAALSFTIVKVEECNSGDGSLTSPIFLSFRGTKVTRSLGSARPRKNPDPSLRFGMTTA